MEELKSRQETENEESEEEEMKIRTKQEFILELQEKQTEFMLTIADEIKEFKKAI